MSVAGAPNTAVHGEMLFELAQWFAGALAKFGHENVNSPQQLITIPGDGAVLRELRT